MHLWTFICCCCSQEEEIQQGVDESKIIPDKKPDFPRIVIQEPTPLVPRKESEIAEKDVIEEEKEDEADIGTVKPQAEPSEGRVEGEGSKKKVTRKVSIPILDLEIEKSEKNKEDEAGKEMTEVSAGPSSPESSCNLQTSEVDSRRVSNVSTSSSWSWPTQHEAPQEPHNMLELNKDGSRRYSHLPPAEINDPLATKVEGSKFVKIPHPGK